MAKLQIGGKARIKQEAWIRFCKEHDKDPDQPNPGEKQVVYMPSSPPFTEHVMLSWPYYWWKTSDLEPVD